MAFQATKRSIRTSEGRRSCGAMFFLIRDCERDTEDLRLALDMDVAREMDWLSWFIVVRGREQLGKVSWF
jgi:hypothetical protein